jgi:hypothetical protein
MGTGSAAPAPQPDRHQIGHQIVTSGPYGDKEALSPGQLKHWVEAKIKDVHKSVDGAVQEEQVLSKKRNSLPKSPTRQPQVMRKTSPSIFSI